MAELPGARDIRPGAPGPTGFRGVGTLSPGLAAAGQQIARAADVYATAEQEKEVARSEDAGYELKYSLESALSEGAMEIDKTSRDSREYEQRIKDFNRDTISTAREQLLDVVKDRKTYAKFGNELSRIEHSAALLTANRANERFLDEDKANTSKNRERNITGAIAAPTDEEAERLIGENVAYLRSKAGRTLSHTEFEKIVQEDAYRVGVGRTFRAVDATGGDLEKYEALKQSPVFLMMRPEDQTRADQRFVIRANTAAVAIKKKAAEDLKEFEVYTNHVELFLSQHAHEMTENQIYAVARGQQVLQAVGDMPRIGAGRPVLTGPRVEAILKVREARLKAPTEQERKNDPAVERDLSIGIANATTPAQIRARMGELDARYANGNGIYENGWYTTNRNALDGKLKALSGDPAGQLSRLAAQHADGAREMRTLFGITADMEMKGLEDPRMAAYLHFQQEYNRASSYHNGPDAPLDWVKQNTPRMLGAMAGSLNDAIDSKVNLLPPAVRGLYNRKDSKASVGQMFRRLQADASAGKLTREEMGRHVRALSALREYLTEMERQGRTTETDLNLSRTQGKATR